MGGGGWGGGGDPQIGPGDNIQYVHIIRSSAWFLSHKLE
jgi:hypothetical protein